jgi:hypothetical protein
MRFFQANRSGLHYESFGNFASCIVGNRDYGAVGYRGVGEEVSFELCWSNLMTLPCC